MSLIKQQIEKLKRGISSPETPEDRREVFTEKLAELEALLLREEKSSSTPSPTADQPSVDTHLEKLKQFDKQEVLALKGADLANYQKYRDEDESVMAIHTAARNSSRKTVKEAAKFLKSEAAKKNSNEAELKKLLLRLNALLKVEKESKPDCKTCKARAGKKAISTKKRNGQPTTYAECKAMLESLPKKELHQVIDELAGAANEDASGKTGATSSKQGESAKPSKAKSKPAKPGSSKYTQKMVKDSLTSVKRIVTTKAKQDPLGAYKGLCQLKEESDLVSEAGGLVLFRAGMKKFKTYASGLVNNDFLGEFDQELEELFSYVEDLKKKAELEKHKK